MRAIENEIQARLMLGEVEAAERIAADATTRFPDAPFAWAAHIQASRSSEDARRVIAALPPKIADQLETLLAIASRQDLLAEGEAAARHAVERAKNDPRAWLALGTCILNAELARVNRAESGRAETPSRSRVVEARAALSTALDLLRENDHRGFRVVLLLRRVTCSRLLHDAQSVQQDMAKACELAPEDPEVLLVQAKLAGEAGDNETVVNLLRRVVMRGPPGDEPTYFLAVGLWHKNADGDRAEALGLFSSVARMGRDHAEPATELAVDGLVEGGDLEGAIHLIDDVAKHLDPGFVSVLRAQTAQAQDNASGASDLADEALEVPSAQMSRAARMRLARLLSALGRHHDALGVLVELAPPGGDAFAGRTLVECAMRLGRHDVVLEYCKRTRETGTFDEYLVERELHLLERYDPAAAMALLRDLLVRDPSDHRARLSLMLVATRLGLYEVLKEQLPLLPLVTEVSAEEGAVAVRLLLEAGRVTEAEDYAYDLLRRHFDNVVAHRAFRNTVLRGGEHERTLVVPDIAAGGVAVCLAEGPDREWWVIEDSPVRLARVDDHEVPVDSTRAALVLGKRVGDEVVLTDGPGTRRAAVVSELLPKLVFRTRDVLEKWQYRFPDHNELWLIPVSKEGTDETDFTNVFDALKDMSEHRSQVEALYREKMIPIGALARFMHRDTISTTLHVAQSDELVLKCCQGSAEEMLTASGDLDAAGELVIDPTALASLFMLNALPKLARLGKRLIVSPATAAELRALLSRTQSDEGAAAHFAEVRDGKPHIVITSVEAKRALTATIAEALHLIEQSCSSVPAYELATLEEPARKELVDALGQAGAESAAMAGAAGRVLWTDDGVGAILARTRLGVRRAWTQAVLGWAAKRGLITEDDYATASVGLIEAGYTFTSANPSILRTAGQMSEWNVAARAMARVIKYLATPEVGLGDAMNLGLLMLKDAYGELALPDRRAEVALRLFETLGQRPDVTPAVAKVLRARVTPIFGLNVLGARDLQAVFDVWFEGWSKRPRPR